MNTSIRRMLPLLAVGAFMVVPSVAQAALLSNSAVRPGGGAATGGTVDAPGLLIVNKSSTTSDGTGDAKVTAANVAGIELLGYQDGRYRGALAGLGATIDDVNEATCRHGRVEGRNCLQILYMRTHEDNGGFARSAHAEAIAVGYTNKQGNGTYVAGSQAESAQQSIITCDAGRGYVLTQSHNYRNPAQNSVLESQAQSGPCFGAS